MSLEIVTAFGRLKEQIRCFRPLWMGERPMFSNIIASSDELSVLTRVLNDHCASNNVEDTEQRSSIARTLIELFGTGITTEDALRANLRGKVHSEPVANAA